MKFLNNIFKSIAVFLIVFYQKMLRPMMPNSCVFEPSCSEYTKQAIEKYGIIRGVAMGTHRISRCHPWQKNHYDPVP